MKESTVEVKVAVLKVIETASRPLLIRLDSLLSDYYTEQYKISRADLAVLLEFSSAALTMKMLLEDYITQAEEYEVETLHIPKEEFQALLVYSRTTELAFKVPVCNTGLWSH